MADTALLIPQKMISHFQRFEFKYHIDPIKAGFIIEELLNKHVFLDKNAQPYADKSYVVSSIYFDSPDWKCYNENESGEKKRFKIRLRTYKTVSDNPLFFLEIKRKDDSVITKDRVMLNESICRQILEKKEVPFDLINNSEIVGSKDVLEEILYKIHRFRMKPVVLVKYKRIPLFGKYNERFRVTLDYNIEASPVCEFNNNDSFTSVFRNKFVLEVKFDNTLPGWFHHALMRHGLSRRKFSKYFNSVSALKNQLINF